MNAFMTHVPEPNPAKASWVRNENGKKVAPPKDENIDGNDRGGRGGGANAMAARLQRSCSFRTIR